MEEGSNRAKIQWLCTVFCREWAVEGVPVTLLFFANALRNVKQKRQQLDRDASEHDSSATSSRTRGESGCSSGQDRDVTHLGDVAWLCRTSAFLRQPATRSGMCAFERFH